MIVSMGKHDLRYQNISSWLPGHDSSEWSWKILFLIETEPLESELNWNLFIRYDAGLISKKQTQSRYVSTLEILYQLLYEREGMITNQLPISADSK